MNDRTTWLDLTNALRAATPAQAFLLGVATARWGSVFPHRQPPSELWQYVVSLVPPGAEQPVSFIQLCEREAEIVEWINERSAE